MSKAVLVMLHRRVKLISLVVFVCLGVPSCLFVLIVTVRLFLNRLFDLVQGLLLLVSVDERVDGVALPGFLGLRRGHDLSQL